MIMNTSLIKTWALPWPFLRITFVICVNYPGHFYELPSSFVRITIAICTNYPRHLCELPSPFLRITLATQTITFWITHASISNYPRHLIYFPDLITGIHAQEFLKLCTIPVVALFPSIKSTYVWKKIRLEMIWNQYQNNPMYVLGIDIPVSILFLSMV